MKTKIYICIVALLVMGMSVGIVLGVNYLSVQMQAKEALVLEKQIVEVEIAEKSAKLQQTDADILVQQEEVKVYEVQLNALIAKQRELQNLVEQQSALYDIKLGGLPANYDVENFRSAEKVQEQASKGFSLIFGSFLGDMLNNDDTSNVSQTQKLRLSLYEQIAEYLDESYREVAAAKVAYDGSYAFYRELSQEADEEVLFANALLLENIAEQQVCMEEKEALLHALAKYSFDLGNVYMVYENTLTEHEKSFLAQLKSEVDYLEELLASYDATGTLYGYSREEKAERYKRFISVYVSCVDELGQRNADDGTKKMGQYTDYGVGVCQGFLNKGRVIVMYDSIVTPPVREPKKFFYDENGNVIYIKYGESQMFVMDGEVVAFLPEDSGFADMPDWLQARIEEGMSVKAKYEKNYLGIGQ